jgi:hypothetical protein
VVFDRKAKPAKLIFLIVFRLQYSSMSDTPRQKAPSRSDAARARSAAALRKNLKRRKTQAREQADSKKNSSPAPKVETQ